MASTSGSSKMSLWKFDNLKGLEGTNTRLSDREGSDRPDRERESSRRVQAEWVDEARLYSSCHHSDAFIWIGLLYGAIMFDSLLDVENVVRHIWEKVVATKIYLIRHLYNRQKKEPDLVTSHLNNDYESIISQISAKGMTIEDNKVHISWLWNWWGLRLSTMGPREPEIDLE